MDVKNAGGVLRSQGRRGRHGIAAMGGNDFLVCFETAVSLGRCKGLSQTNDKSIWRICKDEDGDDKRKGTYAPPEESEPAMTRTLPIVILLFPPFGWLFW